MPWPVSWEALASPHLQWPSNITTIYNPLRLFMWCLCLKGDFTTGVLLVRLSWAALFPALAEASEASYRAWLPSTPPPSLGCSGEEGRVRDEVDLPWERGGLFSGCLSAKRRAVGPWTVSQEPHTSL